MREERISLKGRRPAPVASSTQVLHDESAQHWVRQGPLTLSDFTGRLPVFALCGPVSGLQALELGCGDGSCARHLRGCGALEVIGVDGSAARIAAARAQEEREPLGVTYEIGEPTDLSRFPDGRFDLVLAMFVLNGLSIAETGRSMAEAARVLRPGGRFVFAVPHPALPFVGPPGPPLSFDRLGTGYFSGRDVQFPGRFWKRDGTPLDVRAYHKTLEDYFETLAGAGFGRMPRIRELGVTPEIRAADPSFFGPLDDAPIHLAVAVER